jgi:hypothetical protein
VTEFNSAQKFVADLMYYNQGNFEDAISDYHNLSVKEFNAKYHRNFKNKETLRASYRRAYAQLEKSTSGADQSYSRILRKNYKQKVEDDSGDDDTEGDTSFYGDWNDVTRNFLPDLTLKQLELIEYAEGNKTTEYGFVGEYISVKNSIEALTREIRSGELNFEDWARLVCRVFHSNMYRDNFSRYSKFNIAFDLCYEVKLVSESGEIGDTVGNIRYYRIPFSTDISELLNRLDEITPMVLSSNDSVMIFVHYIKPLVQLIDSGKFRHQFNQREGFYCRYKDVVKK